MSRSATLSFLLLSVFILNAQSDSLVCGNNCIIREGVYLTWESFRHQHPLMKEEIHHKMDKNRLDFFNQLMKEQVIRYSKGDTSLESETKNIWGFFQNGYLFLNYDGEFYRVPIFGAISYMIAVVEVINPGGSYYTPGYGMMNTSYKTNEVRSFLMNYYEGKIRPFSQGETEELMKRDRELFTEYSTLKRKQKKEQISRYIRKFNERNPIYFLK